MPDAETWQGVPPARRALRFRSRRMLSDYIGGEPDVVGRALSELPEGVPEKIRRILSSDPTKRLTLAIHELNPDDTNKHDIQTFSESGEQFFVGATERQTDDAQAVPTSPSPGTATGPNSPPVDDIVTTLLDVYKSKGESDALDYIYDTFHPLIISDRDISRVDRILSQVDIDEFPASVLMGLLMTSNAHKQSLGTRRAFLAKVRTRLSQLPDGSEVAPYLADLE